MLLLGHETRPVLRWSTMGSAETQLFRGFQEMVSSRGLEAAFVHPAAGGETITTPSAYRAARASGVKATGSIFSARASLDV
jgi:hypothetical protein